MLNKKTKTILMVTAVIFITSATTALAHGRWDGRRDMGPGPHKSYGPGNCAYGRGGYGPELTEEQKKAIGAARDDFFKETESLRIQIRDKRLALGDAIRADNPDKDKIMALQKDLSGLEAQSPADPANHQELLAAGVLRDAGFAGRRRAVCRNHHHRALYQSGL